MKEKRSYLRFFVPQTLKIHIVLSEKKLVTAMGLLFIATLSLTSLDIIPIILLIALCGMFVALLALGVSLAQYYTRQIFMRREINNRMKRSRRVSKNRSRSSTRVFRLQGPISTNLNRKSRDSHFSLSDRELKDYVPTRYREYLSTGFMEFPKEYERHEPSGVSRYDAAIKQFVKSERAKDIITFGFGMATCAALGWFDSMMGMMAALVLSPVLLDIVVKSYRMKAGSYGTNSIEASELITATLKRPKLYGSDKFREHGLSQIAEAIERAKRSHTANLSGNQKNSPIKTVGDEDG